LDNHECINYSGTFASEGLRLKHIDLCTNGLHATIRISSDNQKEHQGLDLQVILAQHYHQGVGHDECPLESQWQLARHGGCQAVAVAQMCPCTFNYL